MTNEENENINHDNLYELSNTELSTGLLDLIQALPEPYKLKNMYIPNSEVSYLEHTHVET